MLRNAPNQAQADAHQPQAGDDRLETVFDALTALAAAIWDVPISLLALVDADRVRFESRFGLDQEAASRVADQWGEIVKRSAICVLPDTLADEQFATNPLVTSEPFIRFYAGVPVLDPDGQMLGALCVIDRIPRSASEQNEAALRRLAVLAAAEIQIHRAVRSLEESEGRLQSIMGESSDAFISFGTDGEIREWNPEAERLLGWTRDEIIGSSVRGTVVPGDLWERVVAVLSERAPGEGAPTAVTRLDVTVMTKPGRMLPVGFTFMPVRVAGATQVDVLLRALSGAGVVLAVKGERMLRAEQAASAALATENEELLELDALKDRFVSVVSHELRSPLTAIRGYLELVLGEEPGPLNEEQRRFLQIADDSSEHLLRVVGDLLLIGKLETGQLALEIGEFDLSSMLEACVLAARPAAEAKQIDLRLAGDDVHLVTGDIGRLRQALGNVISNAIKFTQDGQVVVSLRREDSQAVIEVIDTGAGVPRAEIKDLFVPFFRASTAIRQAIPGTGLGLSIAKEIIEAHHGRISVTSVLGLGTTFRVELPMDGAPS